MAKENIIASIILISIGIMFFFNNKNIAKGATQFYKKFYTEKNLRVMFKVCSIILILGGIIVLFT